MSDTQHSKNTNSGLNRRSLLTRGSIAAAGAAAFTGLGAATVPAAAAGTGFTAIRPFRTYDSRRDPQGEHISSGEYWTIGTFTDVAGTQHIPAAQAIAFTVTVVAATSHGFVTITPGNDKEQPTYSTINWDRSGQVIANSSIVQVTTETIDGQQYLGAVNVHCGGGGKCAVIIDVAGYFG